MQGGWVKFEVVVVYGLMRGELLKLMKWVECEVNITVVRKEGVEL
jgi:hypothetical protein